MHSILFKAVNKGCKKQTKNAYFYPIYYLNVEGGIVNSYTNQ